jgi:hypothetical protein
MGNRPTGAKRISLLRYIGFVDSPTLTWSLVHERRPLLVHDRKPGAAEV